MYYLHYNKAWRHEPAQFDHQYVYTCLLYVCLAETSLKPLANVWSCGSVPGLTIAAPAAGATVAVARGLAAAVLQGL